MLDSYKTCIKGTVWSLKRVIEEINLLDLHLSVLANTLFSELGNALFQEKSPPANTVNAAKEKRRKVLDGVFQRRRLTYKRYNLRKIQAYYQHCNNAPDVD